MSKFGTTKQILFLFVILAIFLLVTSGFLFYSLGQSRNNYNLFSQESTKLGLISDIRANTGNIHIAVLRFILTTSSAEMDAQVNTIHDYSSENEQKLEQIDIYLETENERQLYNQVIQANLTYNNNVNQLFQLRTATQADRLAFNISNIRPAFDNYSNELSACSTEIANTVTTRQTEAQNQINLFRRVGIGLPVVSIILILALAGLTFTIIRNLQRDKLNLANETEQRRRAIVELEASNKELESFAYSVSHDLRTPLRSLEGFSEALIEDYQDKLDEQGKRFLGRIQDASVMMARLIDDILKLSRITRAEMKKERVNLSDLAQSVIEDLKKKEPERQVKVVLHPDLVVEGDARLLRVVLENLIGNAWKFTAKTTSPEIEVGVINQQGSPTYFVKDNGAGFDMTYTDKLFQPFQRLHKTSDYPGTGIGLATAQRIIRRHGGRIWAEAKEAAGATFFFTLS